MRYHFPSMQAPSGIPLLSLYLQEMEICSHSNLKMLISSITEHSIQQPKPWKPKCPCGQVKGVLCAFPGQLPGNKKEEDRQQGKKPVTRLHICNVPRNSNSRQCRPVAAQGWGQRGAAPEYGAFRGHGKWLQSDGGELNCTLPVGELYGMWITSQ